MKVLIIGSSGQLGRATIKHLKNHHYQVYGIDMIASPTTDELIDITDKEGVTAVCQGFDAIIHTTAVHGKHYELGYPREAFVQTNITGTLNLLNACIKNNIKQF